MTPRPTERLALALALAEPAAEYRRAGGCEVPPLGERDYWRAVSATLLARLRAWSR